MAWGEKPYKPALRLVMPFSNAVPKALNSQYVRAAVTHPYPGYQPRTYTAPISNEATQKARPRIARFGFFNFFSTNNGKKPSV